jgi:DMSO/TMAO reductase YedYZ molybdopterin-dependent catalytic subunit
VTIFKRMVPFGILTVLLLAAAGWTAASFGSKAMAVAAQTSPVPMVSVTTLPAMPGASTQTTAPPAMPQGTAPTALNAGSWPQPTPPVGVGYIQVVGEVDNPLLTLTLKDLEAMKPASLTLRFHTYTGVPLIDILNKAGLHFSQDPQTLMRKYVYIQGVDGRSVTISFPEFMRPFNNQLILLAYLVDLRPVQGTGFVQLVIQDDRSTTRYIPVARIIVGEPLQ